MAADSHSFMCQQFTKIHWRTHSRNSLDPTFRRLVKDWMFSPHQSPGASDGRARAQQRAVSEILTPLSDGNRPGMDGWRR